MTEIKNTKEIKNRKEIKIRKEREERCQCKGKEKVEEESSGGENLEKTNKKR